MRCNYMIRTSKTVEDKSLYSLFLKAKKLEETQLSDATDEEIADDETHLTSSAESKSRGNRWSFKSDDKSSDDFWATDYT